MKKAKMNKAFLFLLLIMFSNIIFGQTAYIQVTGEPNLSVFLNNQFKGKTTIEYNGYIIENVTAGKNVIKIVKEGYIPFEEAITVKPGEVFAYQVKPFAKNSVYISERGNTGETDKKITVETGKLIVQSVPIGIKITIPHIEGIDNRPKTKDKWLADKISTGNYEITFSFGQKEITKTIKIEKDKITSVFVNMLNGEFVEKTEEKPPYDSREETVAYINKLLRTQERVYYKTLWCSKCKPKTYDKVYPSNAFTYSRQAKTYSLSSITKVLWYFKDHGVFYPRNQEIPIDFKDKKLNGELTFVEEPCDIDILSGACLRLWIKSTVNGGSYSGFAIFLPNSNSVPLFKKAFLHLQELDSD